MRTAPDKVVLPSQILSDLFLPISSDLRRYYTTYHYKQMGKSDLYTEKDFFSWSKFKERISELNHAWAFRGQREKQWSISPSICRDAEGVKPDVAEKILLFQFKRRAHHYLQSQDLPDTEENLEWLSMMQHYGAPTRLTDWTRSSYVAAYFALESAEPNRGNYATVWAINIPWCRTHAERSLASDVPEYETDHSSDDPTESSHFDEYILSNSSLFVTPVEPRRQNQRLASQRGLFFAPGNVRESFMDNMHGMSGDSKSNFYKLNIKVEGSRREAMEDLRRMNITHESLFPGISGLAKSLSQRLATFDGDEQTIRNIRDGKIGTLLRFS